VLAATLSQVELMKNFDMLAIVDLLKSLHMQAKLWKPYNHTSIKWASFCVIDGRIGDVVNVQGMQCIVCYNEVANPTILA
jgi:hypothetical protein